MPIFQLSMRSQDLDNGNLAATEFKPAVKTFRLQQTFKMKYLKLLHIYTNLNSVNLINGGNSANTIIYARISFLNADQSVFFQSRHRLNAGGTAIVGDEMESNSGFICLGKSVDDVNHIDFRDMYKVLHNNARKPIYINQPFTIELFKLSDEQDTTNTVADTGLTDANVFNYNKLDSHILQPITISEMRGNLDGIGQFINFIFEYENDDTK
tara:strand:- start:91 stop:723 length:633 start_codon:yes stop_codon:yes gene_type:complete